MLNLKARPSITASWFSERPKLRAANARLSRLVILSCLVHALLLTLVIWQPKFRLPAQPVEIPAELELNLGNGAAQTGAPPPSAPQPQQPAEKPAPPVPKTEAAKEQPTDTGDLPQPQPQPTAQPTPDAKPTPPSPQPIQAAVAQPQTEINLGDGIAAPPAKYQNPLEHVAAAADPANVAPVYPRDAAQRHEEGDVVVALYIDNTGKVTNVQLLHSSGSASLDRATIEAASQWHFRPAFHEGVAVPSVREQLVSFRGR